MSNIVGIPFRDSHGRKVTDNVLYAYALGSEQVLLKLNHVTEQREPGERLVQECEHRPSDILQFSHIKT